MQHHMVEIGIRLHTVENSGHHPPCHPFPTPHRRNIDAPHPALMPRLDAILPMESRLADHSEVGKRPHNKAALRNRLQPCSRGLDGNRPMFLRRRCERPWLPFQRLQPQLPERLRIVPGQYPNLHNVIGPLPTFSRNPTVRLTDVPRVCGVRTPASRVRTHSNTCGSVAKTHSHPRQALLTSTS